MTDIPTTEQEALEKAWRLLHLQADTMLKRSQAGTDVWKVGVVAFLAGGVLVAATAALTGVLVLQMAGTPGEAVDCSRTAYRPSHAEMQR
jgi:hypothetical protein